ncbi:hypothetical protein BWR59_12520 [Pseudomonas sp. Bc-h]|uniref:hypothetical protein n=1 Tax=Pseudomonas sp. Bc-h TaxID=1943632 RepID=UPI0009DB6189|nr:hypothetical protein [Pseudomonas sp. Bc-h]OQR32773.1 hypothetical protein BWR59_12520 [Pseudomonas sp. Bc-h]
MSTNNDDPFIRRFIRAAERQAMQKALKPVEKSSCINESTVEAVQSPTVEQTDIEQYKSTITRKMIDFIARRKD